MVQKNKKLAKKRFWRYNYHGRNIYCNTLFRKYIEYFGSYASDVKNSDNWFDKLIGMN